MITIVSMLQKNIFSNIKRKIIKNFFIKDKKDLFIIHAY